MCVSPPLTDDDRAILEAASLPAAARTRAADRLGISPTRFHQRLVTLLETREAVETYPSLVNRQRRLLERRRRARGARP